MSNFNSIGLIAKIGNAKIIESLQRLERYLAAQDVKVTLETTTAQFLPDCALPNTSQEEMGSRCDLVIVVGGDGVILGAARVLAPFGVPILGINRGRLGFLADVSPDDMESKVGDVLAGNYTPEDHFLLEGEVVRDGAVVSSGCALNDVVMHPGELPRMLEFDLHIDDQFVYKQYSDGLIIDPHRFHRLFTVRRWSHHAPQPGCNRAGAHVPAYAQQSTHCGQWPVGNPYRDGV